ncbi:hypothetical protein DFA_08090 [Cavenderia fasciculata]|uniref:NAD(P)-binding domain-containing protein n=1 Tax=Cavenderia fasciculata TaxID=261658 RepID=F4Q502_CACFS|nr:uncharacterized protein DFA_08090 [Cavenderia fasciculata]EGG17108.1 hypothetical protein DFA_08090 [Cavenderia fasciculata]|eukprot:XP_004355592.1 hypothetical protein DFA_08090 [Cavenderia fasciculata]
MERNQESVVITGGQGFIGSWVAKLLLEQTNQGCNSYNVIIVDVKPDDRILRQVLSPSQLSMLTRVYLDIANGQAVTDMVRKYTPSFIIHLAGLQIPTCRANPILGCQVNVIGTINVFEAVKQLEKTCPIIYASSAAVSGPSEDYDGPINDNASHTPLTHYGVYKQANEGSARVYWMDNKIPSVALRPFTVGDICVNYVEDIASLFIQLGQLKDTIKGAHVCNITGDVVSVQQWVDLVKQVAEKEMNKSINVKIEGSPLPYPTHFKEDTLAKLLNCQSNQVKTTPPIIAITKTLKIFKSLSDQSILEFNDL